MATKIERLDGYSVKIYIKKKDINNESMDTCKWKH